jgi:arginine-tRNA-protein transferase
MLATVHSPQSLDPAQLDTYLEQGWFRMGQTIFTTNFLSFKNQLYSAVWLRVYLPDFTTERTKEKLAKLNAGFRTEIQKASITAAQETLFELYRKSISFEASSSLHHLLFGKSTDNITIRMSKHV